MKYILITLLLTTVLSSGISLAGDYELIILENQEGICSNLNRTIVYGTCYTDNSTPYCTSDQVADDLKQYFKGKEPKIKILVSAFGNGHLIFCSQEARNRISDVLRHIKKLGFNRRGRHIDDFLQVNSL